MDLSLLFQPIGINDYADILLMTVIIYSILSWFRSTRAAFIFTGIVIAVGIYVLVQQFDLFMTRAILEKFFAVILIALVVIFQEELRGFFERIAVWSFDNRFGQDKRLRPTREEVDIIARSVQDLARKRIGALVVLKGRDLMGRHLQGGIDLQGLLSEQLLLSLFDTHSIGHDGAAIIEGDRLVEFSCHLPLSKNLSKIKKSGTRHAAALGLAERCDAMCIIVSEERGTISIARHGDIEVVQDPSRMSFILERFYRETQPSKQKNPFFLSIWLDKWKEKLTSLIFSVFLWLWLVFMPQEISYFMNMDVEVVVPREWEVNYMEPEQVSITVSGPRSFFVFTPSLSEMKITLTPEMREGEQGILINPDIHLSLPDGINIQQVQPDSINVRIFKSQGAEE